MKKLILLVVLLLTTTLSFSQTGTVTSVAALTIGASGTDVTSTVANSTTTPVLTLNIPSASATTRGLVTIGAQTFAGEKTFAASITSNPTASTGTYTPFYRALIEGKSIAVGKTFDIFKAWGTVTGSSLSGITYVGLGITNDISGMPTPYLGLGRNNKQNIYLFSIPAALPDGVSQINSRLQVGYDQWSPDTNNTNTLAVNGNISAKGLSLGNNNIITFGGPNLATSYFGWGLGNGSWDSRPNDAIGKPYIIQNHMGLTFNAHSYYGGIRFYNQGYPSVYDSQLVMSIVDNSVGIGTKAPDEKLTVNGKIHAKEVRVDLTIPPDYVFQKYFTGNSTLKPEYNLPTLQEVENFAKQNHHLPEIPSAKEIQEKGFQLGEMNAKLLQKVEELTLYAIDQDKKLTALEKEIAEMKAQVKAILAKK